MSVAWNPGTCGTSAMLVSPRLLRRGRLAEVYRDRTCSGETVCCLANAVVSGADASFAQERLGESLVESFAGKWAPDSSGAFSLHITHSADQF